VARRMKKFAPSPPKHSLSENSSLSEKSSQKYKIWSSKSKIEIFSTHQLLRKKFAENCISLPLNFLIVNDTEKCTILTGIFKADETN